MRDGGTSVAARVAAILVGARADPVEIDALLTQADHAYYDGQARRRCGVRSLISLDIRAARAAPGRGD